MDVACSRPGRRKTFCECISLLKHLVLYQRLVECLYSVCLRSYSLHCCLFIYNKYRHGIVAYVTSHMYHSGKYSIMASSESDKTRICFATSFVVQWLRHPIPTHGSACSRPGRRKTFCECISLLKHLVECLYSVCLRSYSLHCCLFIYKKFW